MCYQHVILSFQPVFLMGILFNMKDTAVKCDIKAILLIVMLSTVYVDADAFFEMNEKKFFTPYEKVEYQKKDKVTTDIAPGIEWFTECYATFVCCYNAETKHAHWGCTQYSGMETISTEHSLYPCNDDYVVHEDMTPCINAQKQLEKDKEGKFDPNLGLREGGYKYCFTSKCRWIQIDYPQFENLVDLKFSSRPSRVGVEASLSYVGQWSTVDIDQHAEYIKIINGRLTTSEMWNDPEHSDPAKRGYGATEEVRREVTLFEEKFHMKVVQNPSSKRGGKGSDWFEYTFQKMPQAN